MKIRFQRAFSPESMTEAPCGVCERPFHVESVLAQVDTPYGDDMGEACPECVGMLGQRYPERFPTLEEFEEAKRRYPEPIWATGDDAGRAEDEGTFDGDVASSWIARPELATEEVLISLIRRCDAFANAYAEALQDERLLPEACEDMLRVLGTERDKAQAAVSAYREMYNSFASSS